MRELGNQDEKLEDPIAQARLSETEHMALYIAEKLKISPLDIVKTWTNNQLIITFGYYANRDAKENYEMLEPNKRGNKKDYAVYFMDSYKYEIKEKLKAKFDGNS